jgi:hypothetical protein
MSATDILGRIGEKVGGEFSSLRVSLGNLYATKVSLGNVVNTIDFSPYATKVSLGETRISIANLVDGTNAFSDLKATRAEIGDLVVNGTTTTINTQTLNVKDNIIEVNLKSDGSENAQTSGIQVNRGLGSSGLSTATLTPSSTEIKVECEPELLNTGTAGTADSVIFYPFSNTIQSAFRGKYFRDLDYGTITYYAINNTQRWQDLFDGGQGSVLEPDVYELPSDVTQLSSLTQVSDTKGFKLTSISQNGTDAFPTTTEGALQVSFVTTSAVNTDKASIIWDDNSGQSIWKFGLGSADADIKVKDILVSGSVKVPDANGLKINNISVGDYATFESAFNTANS